MNGKVHCYYQQSKGHVFEIKKVTDLDRHLHLIDHDKKTQRIQESIVEEQETEPSTACADFFFYEWIGHVQSGPTMFYGHFE